MPRNPVVPTTLWTAALWTLLPALLPAQEAVDWAMVNRIRDEGIHRSQAMTVLEHLTDEIGPRLTGSPEMKEANEWTRQQLAGWGLEDAHLEAFDFGRGWSFSRVSVHLLAPRQTPLLALPKAWTPGTDKAVRGAVERVDIESDKDFEKYRGQLAGKILFLDDRRELRAADEPAVQRLSETELDELEVFEIPESRPNYRQRARERWRFRQQLNDFLVEEKALATVEISSRDGGLVRLGGGGSREPDGNPGIPSLVMAAEHYNWIVRLLAKAGDASDGEESRQPAVELEIDVRARFHGRDTSAYNTVAEIPGSEPGLVMVGAHLDSWHPGTGATDNAAGCVVAMEAMRILQALGVRPRRTIRIALWGGEEQGLLGSRAYVAEHLATVPVSDDPEQQDLPVRLRDLEGEVEVKPTHETFSAYFNLDNGSGRIRGVWAQENAAVVPIFAAWLEPFHDLGADTVSTRNTYGTDHQSFDRVGLPGFQFIQDGLDYRSRTHHTNFDVLDHVVREDVIQASVVMASFLYHAAMRDEPLPRKPMPTYVKEDKPEPADGDGRRPGRR